jgi:RNA polymerase sigma factor (TIGR02999 family)
MLRAMATPEDPVETQSSPPERLNREEFDRLYDRIYSELRRQAHAIRQAAPAVAESGSLVHEAYLKLAMSGIEWENRSHFFFVAARAMRQILVDRARRVLAQKRGGGVTTISTDDVDIPDARPIEQILDVNDALQILKKVDRRMARVVELRYFLGLEDSEIGTLLGISPRTVRRDWQKAKEFLHQELGDSNGRFGA